MKKKFIIAVVSTIILITGLCILTFNPFLVNKTDIPAHYIEAIENQAKGFYSKTVPLVPVFVTIDFIESQKAYYTIHYFPIGTVGMSYTETDGYNIEKPLTGL
ncbi:MAG: hypothetical protein IJA31_01250 [Clostridia bacterium]|nr:hypothetical protein [Clostridia bacterium]